LGWLATKKRVLDISSGGGLLQKEIDILKQRGEFNSDVEIVSLDLAYASREGVEHAQDATHMAFHNQEEPVSRKRISNADKSFKQTAVAGSFTALPFASNSFDGILGSYTFGIHAVNRKQVVAAYKEARRVMTKDGNGFISVIPGRFNDEFRTMEKNDPVFYMKDDIAFMHPNLKHYITQDEEIGDGVIEHYFLAVSAN
jgi:hypothetical protein